MLFDFTDEQRDLVSASRDLFAELFPRDELRKSWSTGLAHDPDRWRAMADVGIQSILVPEERGGLGLSDIETTLVLEEAGYALVSEPLLETFVAVGLLLGATNQTVVQDWLPRLISGDATASVRLADEPFAVAVDAAELLLVESDDDVLAVPADRLQSTLQPSMDQSRRSFEVAWSTADAEPLGVSSESRIEAWDRAVTGAAALLNGTSRRMVDLTLDHVRVREQFGRPIGSFQAIKHRLAALVTQLDMARPTAWFAGLAMRDSRSDRSLCASIAKAAAGRVAWLANVEALQLHGGIGFTWEHDLHMWMKRGKALEYAYGSADTHERVLADSFLAGSMEPSPVLLR